jgi:hypothetical protein
MYSKTHKKNKKDKKDKKTTKVDKDTLKSKTSHNTKHHTNQQSILHKYINTIRMARTKHTKNKPFKTSIHKQSDTNFKSKHTDKLKHHNYINTLIHLYYDNDMVSTQYLQNAHKKTNIYPPQNRIIVIGDIHGDFDAAIKCFILAKCIEPINPPVNKTVEQMDAFFNKLKWIGDDTYVVQLGDQIDRVRPQTWDKNDITNDEAFEDEGSTLEIFYLFFYMDILAKESNGRVFSILGNHEIMNVDGDFRYVSQKEFKSFKTHLSNTYHRNSKFPYHSKTLKNNSHRLHVYDDTFVEEEFKKSGTHANAKTIINIKGFKERLFAFAPTGICSNMMAINNYTILQIGNWLFCHGSPTLTTFNTYTIDLINSVVSMYLLGIDSHKQVIENHYDMITDSKNDSILWNRDFGDSSESGDYSDSSKKHNDKDNTKLCKLLDKILISYNKNNNNTNDKNIATHIALGHTPQFNDGVGINSICNNRVWRCDVGMSKAFGDNTNDEYRKPQVLEILNGNITNVLS